MWRRPVSLRRLQAVYWSSVPKAYAPEQAGRRHAAPPGTRPCRWRGQETSRPGAGSGSIRGPGEAGYLVLSQSEDQNQVHPVPSFVHLMSTQLRGLSLDEVGSAHRSDPQIATHARNAASRQVAGYPGRRINH